VTGEELYDCIYDALEDGKIGTVTIPWRDVPSAERQVWSRIAGDARDIWLGLFCCVAHLLAHGPEMERQEDLARQSYDPVVPAPAGRAGKAGA